MADKLEGVTPTVRAAPSKPETPNAGVEAPKRKAEIPVLPDELTGKFLRVGTKLYRSSDDKTPIVSLSHDRLKTNNIDALPDIVRIAKANGWTKLQIKGGADFKKAAYLAAAAQGLGVEGYKPTKLVEAEAERLRARLAERETARAAKDKGRRTPNQARDAKEAPDTLKDLSERFLRQSHAENAKDPALRTAQNIVAQTISIANAKYGDDPATASSTIEAKRREVAERIARGEKITGVQDRQQQSERLRQITQSQVVDKTRSRGR
jgi:Large polyvalent protein-associated domain 7